MYLRIFYLYCQKSSFCELFSAWASLIGCWIFITCLCLFVMLKSRIVSLLIIVIWYLACRSGFLSECCKDSEPVQIALHHFTCCTSFVHSITIIDLTIVIQFPFPYCHMKLKNTDLYLELRWWPWGLWYSWLLTKTRSPWFSLLRSVFKLPEFLKVLLYLKRDRCQKMSNFFP